MEEKQMADIGMIGLGVMGRNFLLNIAEQGFQVVGYDKDPAKVESLKQDNISATDNINEFVTMLKKPRTVMMLVPAGPIVDSVISDITPLLEPGDILIDGGNSYFKDTLVHMKTLKEKGIDFLGTGISGGEEGARNGPSIMPGGSQSAYEHIKPLFEAAAAKIDGAPCVAYIGPDASGHYVKMVHNGIEYGIMQIISETYDFMKRGLELSDNELKEVYSNWNQTELNSYLLEISIDIFGRKDDQSDNLLINQILDVAKQKGTGRWTTQSAMELQVPTPTIDIAVSMRDLSMLVEERKKAHETLKQEIRPLKTNKDTYIRFLKQAAYISIFSTYAQGMALLYKASQFYNFNLNLESIATIWRGGCIIRSKFLEIIREAFRKDPNLANILLEPDVAKIIKSNENGLRNLVSSSAQIGVPTPGIMASLGYIDSLKSSWLPMNLIQAQRDFFGAHTYERKDSKGTFHTQWEQTIRES